MTLSEFKAWFEGFTEGFGGAAPTEAQFAKIKEKVALIDGANVSHLNAAVLATPMPSLPYSGTPRWDGLDVGQTGN